MKDRKRLLAVTLSSFLLFSCSKGADKATDNASESSTESSKTPGEATSSNYFHANNEILERLSAVSSLAELINREKIPDNETICTVGETKVSVADYKREFKERQEQVRLYLQSQPELAAPLLAQAKEKGMKLTDQERKNLLEQAEKSQSGKLEERLKEFKMSREQFDKEVLDMGLALKMSNLSIEKDIMKPLIGRAFLVDAGNKAGLGKLAYERYVEYKKTPEYQSLEQFAQMTPGQLKESLIKGFIAEEMGKKILEKSKVDDKAAQDFYKEHKDSFKSEARIKWSQIVIAAPTEDSGSLESVRTQVEKQMPGASNEDIEAKVKEAEEAQKSSAAEILAILKKNPAKFQELANEKTDDFKARAAKQGGNMGSMEIKTLKESPLLATLVPALEKTAAKQIYPELVRTKFGYHILKVDSKSPAGPVPFNEVKEELKQLLTQQTSTLTLNKWVMDKQKSTAIVIGPKFDKLIPAAPAQADKNANPD